MPFGGDPAPCDTYGWAKVKSVYGPCPEGYRLPSRLHGRLLENTFFLRTICAVGAFDNGYWFQRFRRVIRGRFYPVPVGNDDFRLDLDGVAVMLTGAASEPTSATPYPTVYFKFGDQQRVDELRRRKRQRAGALCQGIDIISDSVL